MLFLQKAGFMLVELAFASSAPDRRHVVILVSKPLPLIFENIFFQLSRNIRMHLQVLSVSFSLDLTPYQATHRHRPYHNLFSGSLTLCSGSSRSVCSSPPSDAQLTLSISHFTWKKFVCFCKWFLWTCSPTEIVAVFVKFCFFVFAVHICQQCCHSARRSTCNQQIQTQVASRFPERLLHQCMFLEPRQL